MLLSSRVDPPSSTDCSLPINEASSEAWYWLVSTYCLVMSLSVAWCLARERVPAPMLGTPGTNPMLT